VARIGPIEARADFNDEPFVVVGRTAAHPDSESFENSARTVADDPPDSLA
jgi:hypothetical protein